MANMQPIYVRAKDTLSFRELSFDFSQSKEIVLIDGVDETTGFSNGSGKSTILNIISLAWFGASPCDTGKSKGSVKASELIRDGADCAILESAFYTDDGRFVELERRISPKGGKVKITIDGKDESSSKRESSGFIEELIGLTYEQFVGVIYINQGATERFVMLNDTNKKKFFSTIFNLDFHDDSYKKASDDLKLLESSVAELNSQKETSQQLIAHYMSKRERAYAGLEALPEFKDNLAEIQSLTSEIEQLQKEQSDLTLGVDSERNTLRAEKEALDKKLSVFAKLHTKIAEYDRDIYTAQSRIKVLENKKANPPDTCGECGQQLPAFNRGEWEANIDREVADKLAQIASVESNKKQASDLLAGEASIKQEQSAVIERMSKVGVNPRIFELNKEIADRKDRQNRLKMQANERSTKESALKQEIEDCNAQIQVANNKIEEIQKQISLKEENREYLLELKKLFSPVGVRAFVFDSLINELNSNTEKYLQILSDGSIKYSLEFDEDGKLIQKCEENGNTRNPMLLSGGQRQRLYLAVDLALADIVYNRIGRGPNILFLDEVFSEVCVLGKEYLMTLLQELSKTKDCIYVIDHASEFKAHFNRVLRISRKNGEASLVEVNK